MQIWIYFFPGVGGDGFANLLEHANNVIPIDGDRRWRPQWYVDNQIKFYSPAPDRDYCFRNQKRFDSTKNRLNDSYIWALAHKDKHTIVTSHDLRKVKFNASDHLEILAHDYQDIFLTTRDYFKAMERATLKNLLKKIDRWFDPKLLVASQISTYHDRYVYIEDVLADWSSFRDFCASMELDIDVQHFDHYHDLVSGCKMYRLSHTNFAYYYSSKTDQGLEYQKSNDPRDINGGVEMLSGDQL
jgi:hypothetical protein